MAMTESAALVLYSGRWRGDGSFQKVVDSHKRHLIAMLAQQHKVHIAIAMSPSQWMCRSMASATAVEARQPLDVALHAELKRAFGSSTPLVSTLYPETNLSAVSQTIWTMAKKGGGSPARSIAAHAQQMRSMVAQ